MRHEKFSDNEIISLVNSARSKSELLRLLGYAGRSHSVWYKSVEPRLKRLGVTLNTITHKNSDSEILEVVKYATSISDVMVRLGLDPTGRAHGVMRNRIIKLGIDLSNFKPKALLRARLSNKRKKDVQSYLVKNIKIASSRLRKRLITAKMKKNQCEWCGLGTEWNGKPLVLQLDHVDGDATNNLLNNLRILCPNCHSQTSTHSRIKDK